MLEGFEIVQEKVATTFMGDDGNLYLHDRDTKVFLRNENDEIISRQYYYMLYLGDDHFAVCDIINDVNYFAGFDYYNIIDGEYEITTPKMKWGIIRVTRDENGKIIPGVEVMVIPCIYDRISESNLKTAIVHNEGNFTYIDIDRISYGKQLVPCMLNHATNFDKGFAECSINDVVRYLPRNCRARESIRHDELLTKKQVLQLSKYLRGLEDNLDDNTISLYYKLTGESLIQGKVQQLKKTINQ